MAKKSVKFEMAVAPAGRFKVFVDGVRIRFEGGNAEKELPVREEQYSLVWFVLAPKGATYTLKITAPDSAKFQHQGRIDDDGQDIGVYWFKVE